MQMVENNATTNQRRDQQNRAVVGGDDSNTTATVMDGDGRCDGNATAMMAMERGGDGGGTPTSDGRHHGMLAHYVRESVPLELSSFGYKYGAPPTARGRASPTPAPVISTARRGTCRSSMAYRMTMMSGGGRQQQRRRRTARDAV